MPQNEWQEALTSYATRIMLLLRKEHPEDTAEDRAQAVAYSVGAQAFRTSGTRDDLAPWLQGNYGRVWVGAWLNPGADVKEIRGWLLRGYDMARKSNLLRSNP